MIMLIKKIKGICLKYKHYLIATACVMILALVLFFTVVYPYYCLNIKLRFVDGKTGKPIADTGLIVYKLEQHNNSCHGFRLSQPLGLIKTDEYGDAYLNTSYIKAKILFIRNKDYFTFISTNSKTEKYTIKMQKDNSQEYRKKRERRIIEDMLNNVHTLDELKEFKKKIKDIPLSPIIE